MSTFTADCQPIRVARGRPGSLPMTWQDPSGNAIDISSFTLSGVLRWDGIADRPIAVSTTGLTGQFAATWSADLVADLPNGLRSMLAITIVDAAGTYHDFQLPIDGVVP